MEQWRLGFSAQPPPYPPQGFGRILLVSIPPLVTWQLLLSFSWVSSGERRWSPGAVRARLDGDRLVTAERGRRRGQEGAQTLTQPAGWRLTLINSRETGGLLLGRGRGRELSYRHVASSCCRSPGGMWGGWSSNWPGGNLC